MGCFIHRTMDNQDKLAGLECRLIPQHAILGNSKAVQTGPESAQTAHHDGTFECPYNPTDQRPPPSEAAPNREPKKTRTQTKIPTDRPRKHLPCPKLSSGRRYCSSRSHVHRCDSLVPQSTVSSYQNRIADPTAFRQAAYGAPEKIMFQFFGARLLETEHLTALRIDPGHHVPDGPVLAGRVHSLKD